MSETTKERIQGSCPICGSPCFLSETKSGNEYSYFCKTGKHRGFIAREEDIAKLFQIEDVKDAVTDNPFQCPLCNSKAESGSAMVRHVVFEHDKRMSEAMSLCGVELQEITDEAVIAWLGKGQDLE